MNIYPLVTDPVFKQYIWGGSALKDKFGKNIPDNFASESWEVSCHADGLCRVKGREYDGWLLTDVIASDRKKYLGDNFADENDFPLLLKILDANDDLSVQVHPDDALAMELEGVPYGKTEMWYIIDAKPDAKLVYGLTDDANEENLKDAIEKGTLEKYLNYVPVKSGDSFFIPAGTVHAVGKGLLIAEIQQSSNTTYRMYDYNRRDKDGHLRELHVDKAIRAASFEKSNENTDKLSVLIGENTITTLVDCKYFSVKKYAIKDAVKIIQDNSKFEMLICTDGEFDICYKDGYVHIKAGDSVFIPAYLGGYEMRGEGDILRSFIGGE